jgi:valyl-tRNA synthetase
MERCCRCGNGTDAGWSTQRIWGNKLTSFIKKRKTNSGTKRRNQEEKRQGEDGHNNLETEKTWVSSPGVLDVWRGHILCKFNTNMCP